ncbi:MAG: hypothetical protein JSR99_17595 [Proteobacteria bacterium]|nr:hypothetical protein [Pseudomonadota bacterium]
MKWLAVILGVIIVVGFAFYLRSGAKLETVDAGHASSQSAPEPYPVSPKPPPPDATTPPKTH